MSADVTYQVIIDRWMTCRGTESSAIREGLNTVAAKFSAWTILDRSNTDLLSSLVTGCSHVKEVLPNVYTIKKSENLRRVKKGF
jgi:hypothetical protein